MKGRRFAPYTAFTWHRNETHTIPKTGSWTQFAFNVPTIVSPNRHNSPPVPRYATSTAPQAQSRQTNTVGFTESNLTFAETEFLSPIKTVANPAIWLESPSKWTSKTFNVQFTADQLELLSQSASSPDKATYGIYLYMCSYNRAANATREVPKRPIVVEYPEKLVVYVNAKTIHAMDIHKAVAAQHPLNLSENISKTTDSPNTISISYSTKSRWVSTLILTKELTLQAISSELRKTNFVTAENVRQKFFKSNTAGGDEDEDLISTGALVSLKCPLGLCRISVPTRSKYCQHSQCFDCETFLQLNRRGKTWKCPVCSVVVKSWRELIVDGYFEGILQGTCKTDDQVYIESNGDWKRKHAVETTDVDARKKPSRGRGGSVEVNLIDDSAASGNDESSGQRASRIKRRRTEVIDLTLDSDGNSDSDVCSLDLDHLPPMTQEEIDMINSLDSAITDYSSDANDGDLPIVATPPPRATN
ncbi:E3 SUMO-protein ligase pli1, partial [Coemansia sp. RSA 1933]